MLLVQFFFFWVENCILGAFREKKIVFLKMLFETLVCSLFLQCLLIFCIIGRNKCVIFKKKSESENYFILLNLVRNDPKVALVNGKKKNESRKWILL